MLTFRYADPRHELDAVRLVPEIGRTAVDLAWADGAWHLDLPPVAAHRYEYRFELRHPDGRTETVCDPDNPLRAPGGYGERSVVEMPGYAPPAWLDRPPAPGRWRDVAGARVWSPDDAEPVGLLVAHDGGELDRLAGLGRYAATMLPPHHLVLLSPSDRNEQYSANPAYARALATEVMPALRADLGPGPAIGLGVSLGGLAMLHAHRGYSDLFAGLFLQSGSFFQRRLDPQEARFGPYPRIVRFVSGVRRAAGRPVPTVITCGTAEENLANNRDMAAALGRHGYPVRLVETPDAHNMTAWRDCWDPHLAKLAATVWSV